MLENARESVEDGATGLIWGATYGSGSTTNRWNSWPASRRFWRSIPATAGEPVSIDVLVVSAGPSRPGLSQSPVSEMIMVRSRRFEAGVGAAWPIRINRSG
jgi:hypothetical protein